MTETSATLQERLAPDRRRRPTPLFSRYWLRGRRRGGRRSGEVEGIYVDGYRAGEWGLFLALLSLSTADLVLTSRHLAAGGAEMNPLMAWAIAAGGDPGFAAAKLLLTGAAGLVLLVHLRFRLARRAIQALCGVYLLVMVWHGIALSDRL